MNYKKLLTKYMIYVYHIYDEGNNEGINIPTETQWIDGSFEKDFTIEEQKELRNILKTTKFV